MEKYIVEFDRENNLVKVIDSDTEKIMLCQVSEMHARDFYDATVYALKYLGALKENSKLNCKVICIESGGNACFTSGKVYPIVDGKLMSNFGFGTKPQPFYTLQEFFDYLKSKENNPYHMKFIEYKGEVITKEDK